MAKPTETPSPSATADGAEAPAEKKKPPLMKILMIVGILLVQAVAAFFLQKTFLFDTPQTAHAIEHEKTEDGEEGHGEEKDGKGEHGGGNQVIMIDEIVVNPAETAGRRYLAATIGFQTSAKEADKIVDAQRAVIRDAIIGLLSAKHMEELARISYRDSLKTEIKDAVNKSVKELKVENIVFSGYVLQ